METFDRLKALAEIFEIAAAVIGGSAAAGAALGFLYGSVKSDLGFQSDPKQVAERWAQYGGVFGLSLILVTALGVELPS